MLLCVLFPIQGLPIKGFNFKFIKILVFYLLISRHLKVSTFRPFWDNQLHSMPCGEISWQVTNILLAHIFYMSTLPDSV